MSRDCLIIRLKFLYEIIILNFRNEQNFEQKINTNKNKKS